MFKYSLKTKIIAGAVLVALLIFIFIIINYNNSRSKDLQFVVQAQDLAIGLERYFDKFNTYPITEKVNLKNLRYLTENGLNQAGDNIYFKLNAPWLKLATLESSAKEYTIDFKLGNSWELWGNGKQCRIITFAQMVCD